MARSRIGIDRRTFEHIADAYRRRWGIGLCATEPDGEAVFGQLDCQTAACDACTEIRRLAIAESMRWGEPAVELCLQRSMVWAVPLMYNAELLGGLVASATESDMFPNDSSAPAIDVRAAWTDLLGMVQQANCTNSALLAANQTQYRHEQGRAYALHEFKLHEQTNIRDLYLRDEPNLIAAIRRDDMGTAREILNLLLVSIHHHAGDNIGLIKSFFMELVATMCRTAVEVGGQAEELLGTNFASISQLAHIHGMEQLAPWLHDILERIMACIRQHRGKSNSVLISGALEYMMAHYGENISRDRVAKAAHLSPSHFSRLLRQQTGKTFTDLLTQFRLSRATELLRRSDLSVAVIAMDVGFRDQSYFTKVFRKHIRKTPKAYRQSYLRKE